MKSKMRYLIVLLIVVSSVFTRADEGMWLPVLLNKFNINQMQSLGLKLTAEQIYSVNQSCLKDAIITLDHGGCTGSIISQKGLLITNHHCGYGDIAGQSSTENDYLTDGFWAMRTEEELPIEGKSVSFLVRMEDVTERVLAGVTDKMDEIERDKTILEAIEAIESEATGASAYEADVESIYEGNEYYLFVYLTYTDIRMVGAPPSSIGKFGGDTDNWMWPRHTGDFCLLRVYANSENKPAEYSKSNIPLTPKYSLPVSIAGVKENDFSMILGYPGSTDRYLTSYGIEHKLAETNPADIKAKWAKMQVMKSYMDADDATRIAYAESYAYLANFWKKSLKESKALTRLNVYADKKKIEDEFTAWVNSDAKRKEQYGNVLSDFAEIYQTAASSRADEALIYATELLMGTRVLFLAYQTAELIDKFDTPEFAEAIDFNRNRGNEFFNTYNPALEKNMLREMLLLFVRNVAPDYQPELYNQILKKHKGNVDVYADYLFEKSIFTSREKYMNFLNKPSKKTLMKDPALQAAASFINSYMIANVTQESTKEKFEVARRKYIAGLREMYPDKNFYPDANSTMRLTYGSVKPYKAADALYCDYFTTLEGVMEKEDSTNREFIVSPKLKQLFADKNYGPYAHNNVMPVCFLTTHDITGGNSGSPVMNGNGELIGVAFDGNSEAMSSDIKYDVNLQRTICVDVRYVLFVIDKYAGAGYLINEMKIIK